MAKRATKRGDERTDLSGSRDVLICGASFAGLMAARQLAGSGADVLVIDRYEIGERQTSACAIPTAWLEELGLIESEKQRFDSVLIHTAHGSIRLPVPWSFSTFDYPSFCEMLWAQCDAEFETAKVNGRVNPGTPEAGVPHVIDTDRGAISAPLVVDTLGLLLAVTVTAASVQDRDGAPAAVAQACAKYDSIEKLFADSAYAGKCAQRLQHDNDIVVEVVRRPGAVGEWDHPQMQFFAQAGGFVILPKRWVVERTHAWLERERRMVMHHDRSTRNATAWAWLAQSRMLLRRLVAHV